MRAGWADARTPYLWCACPVWESRSPAVVPTRRVAIGISLGAFPLNGRVAPTVGVLTGNLSLFVVGLALAWLPVLSLLRPQRH
jgi:hypothetical protein